MNDPSRRALLACVGALAGLAVAGLGEVVPARAAEGEGRDLEYHAKAQVLLRIAQFTDWPANLKPASEAFVIGILGSDPFGPALDHAVEGMRIADRPVLIRRFGAPEQLERVDLLFVAASQRDAAPRTLARLAGSQTLTIADFPGFVGQGGAVELFMDEGHVRFRIDRRAAASAGLGLRAQLLRAAASVD